jgi:hypothetical protein
MFLCPSSSLAQTSAMPVSHDCALTKQKGPGCAPVRSCPSHQAVGVPQGGPAAPGRLGATAPPPPHLPSTQAQRRGGWDSPGSLHL